MNLDEYEKWLIASDNKKESSAKSYKNDNEMDENLKKEESSKNYYCVGFHFYSKKVSEQNQLNQFIENNNWVNGYDDKYQNRVNKVKVGSLIAAKTTYTMNEDDKTIPVMGVHCIGEVIANPLNGKELQVKWQKNFEPYILKGTGGYRDTISQVHKKNNIKLIFDKADINSELIDEEKEVTNFKESTNKILYGPPGTGKTHYLRNNVFSKYTTQESSLSPEENFINVVDECSWWQVIAIALIEMGESSVNEIYNHPWIQKKKALSNSKNIRPILWSQLQSHTIMECEFVNVKDRSNTLLFSKTKESLWSIDIELSKNLIPELYELSESVLNFKPNPDKIIERFKFITFHQSYAYEDFIEGIKPVLAENPNTSGEVSYCIEDGVFKDLCNKAKNDPNNRYAIFIDEINRGNVSAIFGELITLIETDKRIGAENEIIVELPYSKTKFGAPSNIDIYGTMNTADRSVESLDTALRRRFVFKEMMPDSSKIENPKFLLNLKIKLSKVLKTINKRIEVLIDREHTIGHSYFMNITTEEALANTFNNNIVPLLQEYFYGDYGKIGLVLGKGFVDCTKQQGTSKKLFADFKDYDDLEDFNTKIFSLKKVQADTIIKALHQLLNSTGNSNNSDEEKKGE